MYDKTRYLWITKDEAWDEVVRIFANNPVFQGSCSGDDYNAWVLNMLISTKKKNDRTQKITNIVTNISIALNAILIAVLISCAATIF